ncbi:MAG TPA: hypothetical protein PLD40_10240 [Kiritimatiellia bacterium]|nr:hypothetical protein [Kiritimatiellia bacterium]HOE37333.1 hypothetical protein [Kiritimatiellia bacterium]HOR74729.1 hypothetical protein [Kiritimatiellia bacterium]HOU59270.1 hypothetical protein [Kiritimatiellia bacterium]HPK69667.1 hypothetical protein [Kiritimatiellia bacterium]
MKKYLAPQALWPASVRPVSGKSPASTVRGYRGQEISPSRQGSRISTQTAPKTQTGAKNEKYLASQALWPVSLRPAGFSGSSLFSVAEHGG